MRIPLATTLKPRTGAPDKDASLKNCHVEVKYAPQYVNPSSWTEWVFPESSSALHGTIWAVS